MIKFNKLLALVSGLVVFVATTANSVEFRAGVTAIGSGYFANVQEGLKQNSTSSTPDRITKTEAIAAFSTTAVFAETAIEEMGGLTVGVEVSMENLDLGDQQRTITNTSGDSGNATGTQVVGAEVTDMYTVYLAMPVGDSGAYVKAGYMIADLTTKENLATGSTYKDADIEAISLGMGYDGNLTDMIFWRAEGMYQQIDDIKLTGSQADEDNSSSFNTVTAELGGVQAKLSLGMRF